MTDLPHKQIQRMDYQEQESRQKSSHKAPRSHVAVAGTRVVVMETSGWTETHLRYQMCCTYGYVWEERRGLMKDKRLLINFIG